MQGRKRSFAAGIQHTQGLARNASALFFRQETHEKPVTRRKIFCVFILTFLGYLVGALVIIILFFQTPSNSGPFAQPFADVTAPPVNWGNDSAGNPCPFGGCTVSPTLPPFASSSPVTAG